MESLESGVVRVRNVRLPTVFRNCDFNSDGAVPFFCEGKDALGLWAWGNCDISGGPDPDAAERACHIECVTSQGANR